MGLKSIIKGIPGAVALNRWLQNSYRAFHYRNRSIEDVFGEIFKKNGWGGDSVSGIGSGADATRVISRELPKIIEQFEIKSMLDIPCGDFRWMSHVVKDWPGSYVGADIVKPLLNLNRKRYPKTNFLWLDLTKDRLVRTDLVFVRDCMVHLPLDTVQCALDNIYKTGFKYLMATTFPGRSNREIVTGQWRPINLCAAPFNLPKPILLVNEECTEDGGEFSDKSMGLWKISN